MNVDRRDLWGGFADSPPAPLASSRHLRRFLYISIGIALAMLLQARSSSPTPVGSRVPLYISLIAVELALVWFVTIGIRAGGHRLVDLLGRGWRTAGNALLDLVLAVGTAALL